MTESLNIFIKMIFCLVVVLFFWLSVSLLAKNPYDQSVVAENSAGSGRQPASSFFSLAASSSTASRLSGENMGTYSMGSCLTHGQVEKINSSALHIRLVAELCSQHKKVTNSKIINESNQFKATVFSLEKSKFTTDYIKLTEGLNRIRIVHELEGGEKWVSQVVVHYDMDHK